MAATHSSGALPAARPAQLGHSLVHSERPLIGGRKPQEVGSA